MAGAATSSAPVAVVERQVCKRDVFGPPAGRAEGVAQKTVRAKPADNPRVSVSMAPATRLGQPTQSTQRWTASSRVSARAPTDRVNRVHASSMPGLRLSLPE